jgi:hypothetical protein
MSLLSLSKSLTSLLPKSPKLKEENLEESAKFLLRLETIRQHKLAQANKTGRLYLQL